MGLNNCKDSTVAGEYVEGVVCNKLDVPENGMKAFDLGEDGGRVLIVRQGGKVSALGTKCSHYSAPLVSGALGKGRIRCPWHGACFNIETGDIEEFPGLDSIPCFNVEILQNGGVKVRAKKSELVSNKRIKAMIPRDPKNNTVFLIIGGGAAGLCCAETLRQEGFTGRLILASAEEYLPYDRIKLSKQLNANPENIQLRHEGFFKEHDIEVMLKAKVVSVDSANKCVKFEKGNTLHYDSAFFATGGISRQINIPGINLKNVFTLRTINDAKGIHAALTPESKVVIYGTSFIGMEVAAYCVGKAAKVTVIGRSPVPFKQTLGETLGLRIAKLFREKGVEIKSGETIKAVEGENGQISNVVLSTGSTISADLLVIGLGTVFSTQYFINSGVTLNPNGSVPVNQFLETNVKGVFAGGDIVNAPVMANNNEPATIGHWQIAHYHGRIAGLNMLGKVRPLQAVPFFWTVLFGTSFRYAGYCDFYDKTVIFGDTEKLKCAVYYCMGEKVLAVATVASDPVAAQFAELLYQGGQLTKTEVKDNPTDWWTKK